MALAVLLLSVLLLAGAFLAVGWYAQRRKRTRQVDDGRVSAVAQNVGDRPDQVAASEELARRHMEEMVLREWDGGPPRPNWNRRVA